MKRPIFYFLAILAITSCQQEEPLHENERQEIRFVATHETKTKSTLVGESILWDEGDKIKILWNNGETESSALVGDDRSVAEFVASVDQADAYYAVYPYTANTSLADEKILIELPQNQTGAFKDCNIIVAKADEENNLALRHAVGYVEFSVDNTGTVEFSGAETDKLAGNITINGFDAEGRPECSIEKIHSKVSVNVTEPGTYHMAVLPGTELNGFTIRMKSQGKSESASYAGKLTIGRGQILPLGNITERLKRDGQIESSNEKFDIDNIFDEATSVGTCIPNAVCLDSDLSFLPQSASTLELTVTSETPLTSIRLTSSEYISGIIKEGVTGDQFTLVQGSKSLTVNCTGNKATSFTVPIKLLPRVNGEISLRMCDVNGLMSQTSFNINLNAGQKAAHSVTHKPSENLLFFEGFDRCVWGGDIMTGTKGFSPAKGTPDKTMTGAELPINSVLADTPGSEMIHTTWSATLPVTGTSTLTPAYLASRGFDDYRQMLRVQEHDGFIAVGTSVLSRGYVETLPMTALGDMKSVTVKFKICPMPGCVETIRFDVEKAGVVTSVKVDGQDMSAKSCWHEKVTSRAVMGADIVPIPVSYAGMRWHDVEVRVENVNEATVFSWYPATSTSQVNGFYLDEISIEKASGWDYQSGKDLRVLYWNIQNGMWADQGDGYDNFVEWVKSYNPDVCVWTEAMTIYETGSSSAASNITLTASVANGSGWKNLASRYGHEYLAIAHRSGDDYPQVVTSRYPLNTLATFGRIVLSDDIYHGAGLHQIDMNGTKINLITVHLKPNLDGKDNSDYRKFELEYILSRTVLNSKYASENYIIAGDFNARSPKDADYTSATDDEHAVHQYLYNKTSYVDVIADRYPNRFMTTTSGSRIDYVYLSPALSSKVTDAAVVCDTWIKAELPVSESVASFRTPSDHRPILVNIRVK